MNASKRILDYVAALPLRPDMAVLEIGCGPGVAARLVSRLVGQGQVLAIDRSAKAIAAAQAGSAQELETGRLRFRQVAIENFVPEAGEGPFDLVFAMRVGALDGRHRALEARALRRIYAAMKPDGVLLVDDRPPLEARDMPAILDSGAAFP